MRSLIPSLSVSLTALVASPVPEAERSRLVEYLNRTSAALEQEAKGLSREQWNFKAAPDRWSIAECVEHLALAEAGIRRSIEQALVAPPTGPVNPEILNRREEMIRRLATERTQKFQAPEVIRPTGRTPEESLTIFRELRKATVELAKNAGDDVRLRSAEHPLLKTLNVEEWLLLAAAHAERHTRQIQEVKTATDFPKK